MLSKQEAREMQEFEESLRRGYSMNTNSGYFSGGNSVGGGGIGGVSISQWAEAKVASTEPATKIRDGLGNLECYAQGIHDVIDALEKRLDTVLTPIPPMDASKAGNHDIRPMESHVMSRVVNIQETISNAITRLHGVINRVEV